MDQQNQQSQQGQNPQNQNLQQQQNQQGAILVQWEGPQSGQAQNAASVLQSTIRYIEGLQQDGNIRNYRLFLNLTQPGGFAVLEGQVDLLIDLIKNSNYRQWIMTCQASLRNFTVTTALGGTNGQVEQVVQAQQQAQQQIQQNQQNQQNQQGQQNQGSNPTQSRQFVLA